jgi:glycosyltransferase involved in cell wall biosynthesis
MAEQVARIREDLHFMVVGNRFAERQPYDPRRTGAALGTRLTVLEDRSDLPELYACSDIMVLPTYREGMPRCLVEAGAMGLPSVASDVRGGRDESAVCQRLLALYDELLGARSVPAGADMADSAATGS